MTCSELVDLFVFYKHRLRLTSLSPAVWNLVPTVENSWSTFDVGSYLLIRVDQLALEYMILPIPYSEIALVGLARSPMQISLGIS